MAVEVHVVGRIERGRWAEFLEALGPWLDHRRRRGYAPPRALRGLSGAMNTIRLVFPYPDLAAFEAEEARVAGDREYVRLAMAMPYEGPLQYEIYREAAPGAAL